MAVPFLNNIDLNKYELQNFKIFNIAGDPTAGTLVSGDAGYTWLNTSTNKIRWWDGSATRDFLDTSSSISGSQISGNISGASGSCLGNAATVTNGVYTTGSYADPTWITSLAGSKISGNISGNAATATTSTNLAGGTVGQIPYQSGAGATTFLSAGTAGQLLTSGGAASPTWTTKSDIKLSDLGSPSADLDINGWKITNVGDPTSAQDAATKAYVDSVAQGLDVKASCKVGTIASITLSGPGASIDGISLSVDNRVLVKDQADAKENGIYLWKGAAVAMVRSSDADTVAKLVGAFTFVEQGTNADSGWVCKVDSGTIGSVDIDWVKFSQAGSYTQGRGMVLSGTAFNFAQNTDYTAGRIPFASSATAIGFNANLHWDNTNNRLGIGTATPSNLLTIGSGSFNSVASGTTGMWTAAGTVGLVIAADGFVFGSRAGADRFQIGNNGVCTWSNVGGNAGTAMVLDGTGLGIGGTPVSRLSLGADTNTDGANKLTIYRGGSSGQYTVIENGGGTIYRSYGTGGHTWYITNGTTEAARIDVNGNVGIGVTPNAWSSNSKSLQFGVDSSICDIDGDFHASANAYNASGGWTYISNAPATDYYQRLGTHVWRNASATTGLIAWTTEMTLDASGNLGIGVTPSSWGSSYKALQQPAGSLSSYSTSQLSLNQNAYDSGVGSFVYVNSAEATRYLQNGGEHRWFYAASGTAGNAITFVQEMTLSASGNLGIGVNSPAYKLDVDGSIQIKANNVLQLLNSDNSNAFQLYNNGSSGAASGNLTFTQGGVGVVATLNSTGLGIGASPGYRLDIQNAAGDCQAQIKSGNANASLLFDYVNNYGNLVIRKSGSDKWLFGVIADSSSAPSFKIQSSSGVALTIASTGAATFASTVTAKSNSGTGTGYVPVIKTSTITGDNSTASFTITHNFSNTSPIVQVYQKASPYAMIYTDVASNSTGTTTTITFATAPATGVEYNVTILG